MKKIQADFMIQIRDSTTVIKVGKSSVEMPLIRHTGHGIKWFDE